MAAQACPLTSGRLCLQASASNTGHLKLFTTYGTLIKLLLILKQGCFRFIYDSQRNCLVCMNFICRGFPPLPPPPHCHFVSPPHLPRTFKQRLPTSQIVSSRSLHNRNLEPSTQTPASELYAFSLPWWAGRWGGSPCSSHSIGRPEGCQGTLSPVSTLSGPGLSGVATLWG